MLTRRAVVAAGVIAATSLVAGVGRLSAQDDVDYSDFAPPDLRLALRLLDVAGGKADEPLIERMIAVLTERANRLLATLVHIERLAGSDIVFSVRGTADIDLTIQTLSRRGFLEIVDPRGAFLETGEVIATSLGGTPTGSDSVTATPHPVYETILGGADLADAYVTVNQLGDLVVAFRISEDAAAEFQEFTKANIGQPMAIVVDNVVVTSPVINAPIFTDGVIEGLDDDEVLALVVQLTTEPLPGRIELLEVERRD